jgi:hypothetical protein
MIYCSITQIVVLKLTLANEHKKENIIAMPTPSIL